MANVKSIYGNPVYDESAHEALANKVVASTTNGNIKIDGEETTVYDDSDVKETLLLKANQTDVDEVKSDLSDIEEAVPVYRNLVTEIKEGYIRSNNSGKVSNPWASADYCCAIADVIAGTTITVNYDWVGNSFALFADDDGNVIGTVRDYKVSGYTYSVPTGATKLYFSANVHSYATIYAKRGYVIFEGVFNINSDDYTISKYGYNGNGCAVFVNYMHFLDGNTVNTWASNLKSAVAKKADANVFHVEKDGSGDFAYLVSCINYINDNNIMDAIVYVGAGTWDIVSELGSDYIESVSSSKRGIYIKNRTHVIFSSEALVTCKYTGTTASTIEWLSAFNMGKYGGTLENATIESDNVRYSVHDEFGYCGSTPYVNKYINCKMKHINGKYVNCIGGGLGIDGMVEIRGCYFDGDATASNNRLVYYHGNNENGQTFAKSRIEAHDNYFAGLGTFGLTKYGDSTEISQAFVSNNSVGSAITVTAGSYAPHDNMELIAWNNTVRS